MGEILIRIAVIAFGTVGWIVAGILMAKHQYHAESARRALFDGDIEKAKREMWKIQ